MSEFTQFRHYCEHFRRRFGLSDWRLIFRFVKAAPDSPQARVYSNIDSRVASLELHGCPARDLSIKDTAKHEMLHVLLADYATTVARCRSDEHPDAIREEHRLLERLMVLIP